MTDQQFLTLLTSINAVQTRTLANAHLIAEILKKLGATDESLEAADKRAMDTVLKVAESDLRQRLHTVYPNGPPGSLRGFSGN